MSYTVRVFRVNVWYVTGVTDPSLIHARDSLVRRRKDIDAAISALDRVMAGDQSGDEPAKPEGGASPEKNWTAESAIHRGDDRRGARTDTAEAIIKERPGVGVSPKELAEAMAERGVPIRSSNPVRAARAVADRVRARNADVELENGRFVYRPSDSPNGTPRSGAGRINREAFELPDHPPQEAIDE